MNKTLCNLVRSPREPGSEQGNGLWRPFHNYLIQKLSGYICQKTCATTEPRGAFQASNAKCQQKHCGASICSQMSLCNQCSSLCALKLFFASRKRDRHELQFGLLSSARIIQRFQEAIDLFGAGSCIRAARVEKFLDLDTVLPWSGYLVIGFQSFTFSEYSTLHVEGCTLTSWVV